MDWVRRRLIFGPSSEGWVRRRPILGPSSELKAELRQKSVPNTGIVRRIAISTFQGNGGVDWVRRRLILEPSSEGWVRRRPILEPSSELKAELRTEVGFSGSPETAVF